jgi:serine/threonine-protein kinase
MAADADRHLLFGLLALQNGLIDQGQLVAAFQAWTRDRARPLAEHLAARGDLDGEQRAGVEAMVALHLRKHGGSAERSLAAVPAGRSTRESLERIGDPVIDATLSGVGSASGSSDGADSDRTASYAVGTATGGGQRFRVLRPHARGGLGAVFVALDIELHREVALKQILEKHADDPASRQRFLLEAEVTGGLEHPGIVPVYGLGAHADGRPFYAMRFIRGDSLKEAIDRFHADETLKADPGRRSLELRRLLLRFTDVCDAIEYAHSRGVLHRDLKPGNIIVGKHGETLVVDWGLAKATGKSEPCAEERTLMPSSASGSAETLPGSALGTPAYMSPEQARGELDSLGPRSDVYSLGATLYCLLTGKPPLEGDDIGELLRKAQRGGFPRPRQHDAAIDAALEAVCLKAMSLDPRDRYESCKALAEDVERWMADEPVSARREPITVRIRRWTRRHRTSVASSVAALLVGLVGLGAVVVVQSRANTDLRSANLRLAESNRRERQRFELALSAIKTFHTGVSEDVLLKEKAFDRLRKKLLTGAADFYRKLETLLKGESDRDSRSALSTAYSGLADLTGDIGTKDLALELHRQSLDLRRAMARDGKASLEEKLDICRVLLDLGRVHQAMGHLESARAAFDEALELARSLAAEPNSKPARMLLGRCYWNKGALEIDASRPDAALAADQEASAIQRTLLDEYPDDVHVKGDLANTYLSMGYNQIAYARKPAEALVSFERARELQERVAAAEPEHTQYARVLSECNSLIGVVQLDMGRLDEALAAIERAQVILRKLVDSNPNVSLFQDLLAGNLDNAGIVYARKGDRMKALEAHAAAKQILERLVVSDPSAPLLRRNLAGANNNLGDVELGLGRLNEAIQSYSDARTLLEQLVEAHPENEYHQAGVAFSLTGLGRARLRLGQTPAGISDLRAANAIWQRIGLSSNEALHARAGNHALIAGQAQRAGSGISATDAEHEARRAIDCLQQPLRAGFRTSAELRADPDFRALHGRSEFESLLLDLEFPNDPLALP